MLFPICTSGKYGYINSFGREVVEPRFDFAVTFKDGFGRVLNQRRQLLVNENGETVLESACVSVGEVSEGLFSFTNDDVGCGKEGVMNLRGEVVVPEEFDHVYPYSHGYAVVEREGKAGVIDRQGRSILEATEFEYLQGPDESGRLAAQEGNRWGYVSLQGEKVIAFEFERTFMGNEGLMRVIQKRKTGFMKNSGEWAIAPKFANAESFSGGFAVAQEIPNVFGYVDRQGRWLGGERYMGAKDFVDGLAPIVRFGSGRVPKWGFINDKADLIIPATFLGAESFHGPLSCVTLAHEDDVDVYGYIDRSGELVWQGRRRVLIDEVSGERIAI